MADIWNKRRVCILLMDSLGIGASLDAEDYGDKGANTFAHIVQACKEPLKLPNLKRLGLYHAALASSGIPLVSLSTEDKPLGYYGYAVEQSLGKDTPSGHWEIAGVPVTTPWGYFPMQTPCFPQSLLEAFFKKAKIPGALGLCHGSGTELVDSFGEEHLKTGKPIVYTSADSVFQIAAHEQVFGLERLYEIAEIARTLVDEYRIGRVIARPFIGEVGTFKRSANRRDYAMPPPKPTLLDALQNAGREVIGIGKIADIFAHRGIRQSIKADGNMALFDATLEALKAKVPGGLIFTNFVDFDTLYGHRRDIAGYAKALEAFDARIPELLDSLQEGDLVVITADHGCDPTFAGSDHTREHIPVLAFGKKTASHFIGRRDTFADIGQSIAAYLGIAPLEFGLSFLVSDS